MAQSVDLAAHYIAGAEELPRVHGSAYSTRRASKKKITGFEGHAGGQMLDLLPDIEDQMARAYTKFVRIAHLVGRDYPWPDWCVGVEALAQAP